MAKLEINGTACDAFVDESLLGAARRHKAHIGYACGGHGLCQTCEVIVESGMDALSPMNDVEMAWLTAEKQQKGHRLACQVQIKKDATIKFTTRAEKAVVCSTMRFWQRRRHSRQPLIRKDMSASFSRSWA